MTYERLPLLTDFRLVDIAKDDEALKVWPLLICIALFASGAYIVLRVTEGSLSFWWFAVHQVIIYSLAYAMHRIQSRGGMFWHVTQTRRGFRVVLKPKDEQ